VDVRGKDMRGLANLLRRRGAAVVVFLGVASACSFGETVSYTGALSNPEDTAAISVTLSADGSIVLQSYGFGGGINAAGTTIAAGGFDPFVGLFSGTGDGAVFVDGTSDILTNYTPGCPPAGTVMLGSTATCGDVNLQFTGLAAGTYTVVLSDGAYLPAALFEDPGGVLGDGFFDLTGGVFQTCDTNGDCNDDTADWALDITTSGTSAAPPVPEPASVELAATGVLLVVGWMYCRDKRKILTTKGGVR
jgi:hypothetical protein